MIDIFWPEIKSIFFIQNSNEEKPTKQEKQIASHVRFNCPTKKAVVQGDEVHYFTGAKAVDCLMASKWSADKCSNKANALFANRAAATEFMQR
jgi:translocation protein SEC62